MDIETPHGTARAHLHPAERTRGALVLGHGAGGGVAAADLVAVTDAVRGSGWSVALVEQPYRVAGRRSPPRAPVLDTAWIAVIDALRAGPFAGLPLVTGGRSSGARVACRTAEATDSTAVLGLAFPLHPPGRPEKTRLAELDAVRVPVLVVQGTRDPFGMPPRRRGRTVAAVPGDHGLKLELDVIGPNVADWLQRVLSRASKRSPRTRQS